MSFKRLLHAVCTILIDTSMAHQSTLDPNLCASVRPQMRAI